LSAMAEGAGPSGGDLPEVPAGTDFPAVVVDQRGLPSWLPLCLYQNSAVALDRVDQSASTREDVSEVPAAADLANVTARPGRAAVLVPQMVVPERVTIVVSTQTLRGSVQKVNSTVPSTVTGV
jgi:hypothetical protein